MSPKIVYVLPLLAALTTAYAADGASDEISPQMLAMIQADCAAGTAKAGLSAEEREVMNWLCVTNLRDYDNSISDSE
jgi:hypothetical protein